MGFVHGLIRWFAVVIMVIATVYPDFGAAVLVYRYFPAAPIPVAIVAMAWTVALALVLPLPLLWFKIVSTIAMTILALGIVKLIADTMPWLFNAPPIWIWGVAILAFDAGWLVVSTRLWRWASGILPVAPPEHLEN